MPMEPFGTFGDDMPEGLREDDSPPQPYEPTPEPIETAPPEPEQQPVIQAAAPPVAPAPVMPPQATPQPSAGVSVSEFANVLRSLREEERQQEWAAQQAQARQQQIARQYQPPPLPEPSTMLDDPNVLAQAIDQRTRWAAQLAMQQSGALAQEVMALREEASQARNERASMAWERARFELAKEGIHDADAHLPDLLNIVSMTPETEWKIRTNPTVLAQAVRMIRNEKARLQPAPVAQPSAGPPSAGVTQDFSRGSGTQRYSPILAQVERQLGRPLSQERREEFFKNTARQGGR